VGNGGRAAYTDVQGWQRGNDVLLALARLRDRSWSHIVLSNHAPEFPQRVEARGLSDFIAAIYCAACTGVEKPHRKACEKVFARDPGAQRGWMIGDSWHVDVQGALAVGLRAMLVRSEPPEAVLPCQTLEEVVDGVEGM
jgi:putative hydrolase of the HAD superfamily